MSLDVFGLILIFLLMGYNTAHTTFGILYVAFVTRDKVHVAVEDRLACGCVDIDANVIAIRMEFFLYLLFDERKHIIHRLAFLVRQVKIR